MPRYPRSRFSAVRQISGFHTARVKLNLDAPEREVRFVTYQRMSAAWRGSDKSQERKCAVLAADQPKQNGP